MKEVLSFIRRGCLRDMAISRPRRAYSLLPFDGSFADPSHSRPTPGDTRELSLPETPAGIISRESEEDTGTRFPGKESSPQVPLPVLYGGSDERKRSPTDWDMRGRRASGTFAEDDGRNKEEADLLFFPSTREREENEESFLWGVRVPPLDDTSPQSLEAVRHSSSSLSPSFSPSSETLLLPSLSSPPPPSRSPSSPHSVCRSEGSARCGQVVYVWLDALAGYLTAAGYPHVHSPQFKRLWYVVVISHRREHRRSLSLSLYVDTEKETEHGHVDLPV